MTIIYPRGGRKGFATGPATCRMGVICCPNAPSTHSFGHECRAVDGLLGVVSRRRGRFVRALGLSRLPAAHSSSAEGCLAREGGCGRRPGMAGSADGLFLRSPSHVRDRGASGRNSHGPNAGGPAGGTDRLASRCAQRGQGEGSGRHAHAGSGLQRAPPRGRHFRPPAAGAGAAGARRIHASS